MDWNGGVDILLAEELIEEAYLVLHFSKYTLMTFLMMLSVILLSVQMILLSTLNVIRHLICGNNQNWLLNLNLINETLWTGAASGLLISMLQKLKACVWYFSKFYFSLNDSPSKTMELFFILSKNFFSFLRYSDFCISLFSSFSPCQPLL